MPAQKFYITTLGCKVNQYESQALAESWQKLGWAEVHSPGDAEIIVINTCAVTASAVADVRTTARRLNRENPQAKIWIMGCSAQTQLEQMQKLPGVGAIIPTALKDDFLASPEKWLTSPNPPAELPAPVGKRDYPAFQISTYQRARPVLKLQDGCSHRCTYCIVPLARGASVSRAPQDVLAEARRLLEAGFQEIILSGINLSQFSLSQSIMNGNNDFWNLLELLENELAAWQGKARFRISSLEPGQLGERALDIFARSRLICPQLHISLQSGSPEVLKRMGRGHYDPHTLIDFCRELANIWPVFGLGADILTGFPNETNAEFEETVELVKALPFTYAHVFPFSARPGTPAASMPGQVEKQVATERSAILRGLVQAKKEAFLCKLAEQNAPLSILLESPETGLGVSEYYVECRLVSLPESARSRRIIPVRVCGREHDRLLVEPA